MLDRDMPRADTPWRKLRRSTHLVAGVAVQRSWTWACSKATIGPDTPAGRRFGSMGPGSIIAWPTGALVNERAIHIGAGAVVASGVTLSAGWMPDQPDLPDEVLRIGARCLIGRGSSLVAHRSIVIGDDVWTGPNIYVTDMNHGYDDPDLPVSRQYAGESPVEIGDGSWLGTNVVVLPGVHIGRHVVVGAGSVVTHDLPDHSLAAGAPARVVRRFEPGTGWVRAAP
ncbi:MAG: acyltransferase [Acidimicrobiales bacterium]|jgi:acetyltransferase-like isoleucine patch superfamily enzyme|nr:acyltransferase [Acidimicrobiales bacterium]